MEQKAARRRLKLDEIGLTLAGVTIEYRESWTGAGWVIDGIPPGAVTGPFLGRSAAVRYAKSILESA